MGLKSLIQQHMALMWPVKEIVYYKDLAAQVKLLLKALINRIVVDYQHLRQILGGLSCYSLTLLCAVWCQR